MKNTPNRSGEDRNPKKLNTLPKSDTPKKEENIESIRKTNQYREEESSYILPISDNRKKLNRDEYLDDDEEE